MTYVRAHRQAIKRHTRLALQDVHMNAKARAACLSHIVMHIRIVHMHDPQNLLSHHIDTAEDASTHTYT